MHTGTRGLNVVETTTTELAWGVHVVVRVAAACGDAKSAEQVFEGEGEFRFFVAVFDDDGRG